MSQQTDLWEQQPTESDPAYAAFAAYRDRGPSRTMRALSDELGVHRSQLKDWSLANSWEPRLRAWSRAQERARRSRRRDEMMKMAEDHKVIAKTLYGKALARLRQLDATQLDAKDVVKMIDLGTQLQRAAMGYATEDLEAAASQAEQIAQSYDLVGAAAAADEPAPSFDDVLYG